MVVVGGREEGGEGERGVVVFGVFFFWEGGFGRFQGSSGFFRDLHGSSGFRAKVFGTKTDRTRTKRRMDQKEDVEQNEREENGEEEEEGKERSRKKEKMDTPIVRLRPISTSANLVSASWPKSRIFSPDPRTPPPDLPAPPSPPPDPSSSAGPLRRTHPPRDPRPPDRPKFRSFFPPPAKNFHCLCSLWASSRGISMVCEVPEPSKMHVWEITDVTEKPLPPTGPWRLVDGNALFNIWPLFFSELTTSKSMSAMVHTHTAANHRRPLPRKDGPHLRELCDTRRTTTLSAKSVLSNTRISCTTGAEASSPVQTTTCPFTYHVAFVNSEHSVCSIPALAAPLCAPRRPLYGEHNKVQKEIFF